MSGYRLWLKTRRAGTALSVAAVTGALVALLSQQSISLPSLLGHLPLAFAMGPALAPLASGLCCSALESSTPAIDRLAVRPVSAGNLLLVFLFMLAQMSAAAVVAVATGDLLGIPWQTITATILLSYGVATLAVSLIGQMAAALLPLLLVVAIMAVGADGYENAYIWQVAIMPEPTVHQWVFAAAMFGVGAAVLSKRPPAVAV